MCFFDKSPAGTGRTALLSMRNAGAIGAVLLLSLSSAAQNPLLTKHVPDMVKNGRAEREAAMKAAETLELVISLPLRNQAEMDGLTADLYNPQSPNYRHWLKPAEFDARFAPADEDYAELVAWARQSGFTIVSQAANRHILSVSATAAVVNRALHIELTKYHDNVLNRDFHAPDREPTVDLDVPVLAISGLDTSSPRTSSVKKGPAQSPSASASGSGLRKASGRMNNSTITGSGPDNTYLPSDLRAAYYGSGPLTGAGQTVGIFSFDGYLAGDLAIYYANTGMTSTVPVTNVLTGGFSGGCVLSDPCDDGEQILDIVQVQGMAPGLSGILFYEGTSAVTELNQMVSDDKASVITCSWYGFDFGAATEPLFEQMALQGQTFLAASGDGGGYNGFNYGAPDLSPWVVVVGGTDLTTTAAGGAWASETAWADSGGGYLDPNILIPSWQQQPGVITVKNAGSSTLRNSPDMAAEADFDNSLVSNGTFYTGYGGTSYAAPRMAGYLALANEQSVANGYGTIGFISPLLYEIGLRSNSAQSYHDITSGSAPSSAPKVSYSAVKGYDLVTGWGSPNGPGLVNALTGPDFSLTPASTSLYVARGESVGSTITVTDLNGYTGKPPLSFSGLPAGVTASYKFLTDTLIGFAFTSAADTPLASTPITLTGAYGRIAHSVVVNLTTGKRADDDFTLSASNASVTQMASGGSVVTVMPGAGLVGPVSLTVSGLPAGVSAAFDNDVTFGTTKLTFTAAITATPGVYAVTVSGTAGAVLIHTATLSLTVNPVASALANGGGETGDQAPWTYTSTYYVGEEALCSGCGFYPHSGAYFFYINGVGATDTDVLSQQFTVSGGTTRARLNFWLWIASEETTTTEIHDTLRVSLHDPSGKLLTTLTTLSNLDKTSTYAFYSFDISEYLGQTVVLKFQGNENNSKATAFLLDDMSVVVQ